jgi:peptidoglycan-N-acetylglucosamine deacetylase
MKRTILLALVICFISCREQKREAGICISFDDRSIKEWYSLRPILNKYNAKVTFFVSQVDSLSKEEIEMLHQLQNDGHEIGSHGAMHVQAEAYIKKNGYSAYIQNEINPSISKMKQYGFDPKAFAYPYGSKYWFTDFMLLKKFKSTRGIADLTPNQTLDQLDKAYYGFTNKNAFYSVEIDGPKKITEEMIAQALNRAAKNREVLLLSGHEPSDDKVTSPYHFSPQFLEYVLSESQKRQLKFYRFTDFSN